MAFEPTKISYSGNILEVALGEGAKALKIGGETAYPFHGFEGKMPNKPVLAMEVWDMQPEDWPEAVTKPFEGVLGDPAAWAKKCVDEYGAEAIVVQLKSTDPNDKDASPESASATVGKVLAAVDVPVIVWGCANANKDSDVLKKIAEDHPGKGLTLGPVEEDNHKAIGAAALAYGQTLISSSPIDVNLAKQLNILLGNLGVPMKKLVIDPTTGGLGYGMEYSYSVMERISMAALVQEDDKLTLPMINNVGNEVWKCKEAKMEGADSAAAKLGDDSKRGVFMEITAAIAYLMAGSDVLILRHPETVKQIKAFLAGMMADRAASGAKTQVDRPKAKLIPGAAAPKAAPKAAPAAAPKAAPKAAAAAKVAAAPKAAAASAAEAAPAAAASAAPAVAMAAGPVDIGSLDPEALAKAVAAAEELAKKKAAAEKAAAAAAEMKAKKEAAAKIKAELDAKEAASKKLHAQMAALRAKRTAEREHLEADRAAADAQRAARVAGETYGENRPVGYAGREAEFVARSILRWQMRGDGYLVSKEAQRAALMKAASKNVKVEPKVAPQPKAAPVEAKPAEAASPAIAAPFMHTIAENLNVIKTVIGKAFKARDPKPIQELALAEKARGANWIDINLGPARKGGPELMEWVVKTVQEVVPDVPLALDTSNIEAIEAGLAVHKGTALVNSIMARPERYTKMIPMAAKYGADVIALLWGPDGLPRDEGERAVLCEELVGAMNAAGIPNEKIFVDPIITPLNIQQPQLMSTLAFMEMMSAIAPGCKSTNGLSNISNGTPWREPLNQVYMIMLQRAGMYSCIIDYEDDLIMDICQNKRADLVEIVHKVQDGEIKSPKEVPEGMPRTFVAAAQAILGQILYSDSWFEVEGGAKPE